MNIGGREMQGDTPCHCRNSDNQNGFGVSKWQEVLAVGMECALLAVPVSFGAYLGAKATGWFLTKLGICRTPILEQQQDGQRNGNNEQGL